MIKILVVDDEPHITELLQFNLELNDFDVIVANDGKTALDIIKKEQFDFVVLDVMLPYIDGLDLLKIIRRDEKYKDIPVLMLTAKNGEADKILGLEAGADDYITKPFSIKEFIARINALLRRTKKTSSIKSEKLVINNLMIDSNTHTVVVNGYEIELTYKEFEVLLMLCESMGKVVKRDDLLDKIWGYEFFGDTRTVDVHIRHIRKKIQEYDPDYEYIETIRGIGYKVRQ